MKQNVVSLFDGPSTGQLALNRAGVHYDTYTASEIDIKAIMVAMKNFPETRQVGNVKNIKSKDLGKVWLLMGGSPCGDLSVCGKKKGMITKTKIKIKSLDHFLQLKNDGMEFEGQSYLFWEFLRILKETKPKYFFLENVCMTEEWENVITKELGVSPIRINSSRMSCQNRDRLYWTNIPNASIPNDMNIHISDVIPNAIGGYGERGVKNKITGKYEYPGTTRKDGKGNCLTTNKGNTGFVKLNDGSHRPITVNEAEQFQTLPVDYTRVIGVSNTDRFKMIGNGWTVDVISHILKGLLQEVLV
jgi:DNA (cytosine-5)-methyltransferase 3A